MISRRFTRSEIKTIRGFNRAGWTIRAQGIRWNRPPAEIDLALWYMIGRTDEAATEVLNAKGRYA